MTALDQDVCKAIARSVPFNYESVAAIYEIVESWDVVIDVINYATVMGNWELLQVYQELKARSEYRLASFLL